MALSPQDFDRLRNQLLAQKAANMPTPTAPQPSFLQGVKQDFTQRVDNAANAQVKALQGDQTDASAAYQTVGQGFGFAGDIAARGISAVTPDAVGSLAIKGVQKAMDTQPAQDLMGKYQQFKSLHPEAAANLEASGLIAGGLMAPGAANFAAKGAINAVGGTAKLTSQALGGITDVGMKGIKAATAQAAEPAHIMQRVARISKPKQAAFQERAGESVGQYLVKRGIFGDIDEITSQLFTRFEKSKGEADKAYASLKGEYKNTAVGSALKELAAREQRVSSPGAISKDSERVRALLKKNNGAGLNMSEINEVKRLYERNVRLDYVKENAPDKVARANNVDSAVREWQRNTASQLGFKNVQQINKETMLAKQLLDDLGVEYAGSAGNNAVSITDWIMLSGGDPTAVGGFLAKKALSSKGVMSKIAKMLTKQDPLGQPKAQMGTPTIDNYLNFLKKTTQPTIDLDTPIKDAAANAQPGLSMKKVPNFHEDDLTVMSDFTDLVAGSYRPPEAVANALRLDAQRIADHYGLRYSVSKDETLANEFGRQLEMAGWNGTPSSKPSTVGNTFISKKPNGKEGGLGRTTSMSDPFGGGYLYHGTGEINLDTITKEGLKPGRRGALSLSKTEDYARSYAEGAQFPPKKGAGVMFRVKSDYLKGKTATPDKPRPASDDLNEILTKDTIPPEAIEVFKDGKWQPLVSSPSTPKGLEGLAADIKAGKYKNAEEFARSQTPIFRGRESAPPINRIREGATPEYTGTSFSRQREQAQKYGDLMLAKYMPETKILQPNDIPSDLLAKLRAEFDRLASLDDADTVPIEKLISKVMNLAKTRDKEAADIAAFFPGMAEEAEIRLLGKGEAALTKSQLTDLFSKLKPKK